MKILFVGSLISSNAMEELNNISKVKASIAPINFEASLIKGLFELGVDITVASIPAIAAYPKGGQLYLKGRCEKLSFGVDAHWMPMLNIQLFKQAWISRYTNRFVNQWLKHNAEDSNKLIMMYSIYPPYSKPVIRLCKRSKCRLNTIVTDLPEYMYTRTHQNGVKALLKKILSNEMVKEQTKSDSYILLTKHMARRMQIEDKPYLVIEGFSDVSVYETIENTDKYEKKTITYAGALSNLYGIDALMDAFMQTYGNFEFHVYGYGNHEAYVKECAKKDSRIKFFGRVSRVEVLKAYKRSHLLVINKPTSDDYSKYSFSSKILEYICSGTPVLMTPVGGMPHEYYPYVYRINSETSEGIAAAITETLRYDDKDLANKGMSALKFALENKSYDYMCKKILTFLDEQLK